MNNNPASSGDIPDPASSPTLPPEEPAEGLPALPIEWDQVLYDRTCAVLSKPETNTSAGKSWAWLLVTLILFGLSFWGSFSIQHVLLIIGVVFFHEAGHFIGMRVFGYRNVQMFFVPFFGAAVSGTRHAAPVWQQAVILLLGPLPGIALGLLLAVLVQPAFDESLASQLVIWLVVINAFNLLPFVPLDGGRFLDVLLFARQPWLAAGFRFFAASGLLFLAWSAGSWCLGFVALFTFVGIPLRYQKGRRERAFQGNLMNMPEELEALSEVHRRELFSLARLLNPLDRSPKSLAADMRDVHECMVSRHPGFWSRAGLMGLYVGGILAGIATFVVVEHFTSRVADELARDFVEHVKQTRELDSRAVEQRLMLLKAPGKADTLRPEIDRLQAESDKKWGDLVAVWKQQPERVQNQALLQLLTHSIEGQSPIQRLDEINRMRRRLGHAVK